MGFSEMSSLSRDAGYRFGRVGLCAASKGVAIHLTDMLASEAKRK